MRGNIGNLLKQAQAVQENLQKAQAEVAQVTATGESGAGMVKVTLNGKHEATRVQIDPALLKSSTNDIEFEVEALDDSGLRAETESRFIGPRTH